MIYPSNIDFDIYSSSGCIAFKYQEEFKDFFEICKKSSKIYGNYFSITVFENI